MEANFFVLKLCEKNRSVNMRFKIFVMAFRARKLLGTFEKRASAAVESGENLNCYNAHKRHILSGGETRGGGGGT